MNKLIRNISITLKDTCLIIDIEAVEEKFNDKIEAILQSNNTFRFSYRHPETSDKHQYTGFLEGSKVWFYPQYGEGYLTDKHIQLMKL